MKLGNAERDGIALMRAEGAWSWTFAGERSAARGADVRAAHRSSVGAWSAWRRPLLPARTTTEVILSSGRALVDCAADEARKHCIATAVKTSLVLSIGRAQLKVFWAVVLTVVVDVVNHFAGAQRSPDFRLHHQSIAIDRLAVHVNDSAAIAQDTHRLQHSAFGIVMPLRCGGING